MKHTVAIILTLFVTGLAFADNPAKEEHLTNIRQLTHGGENAEAYFSFDGRSLIFQSTKGTNGCDQIFTMNLDGTDTKLVSTGKGRTTCGYFFKDSNRILYSSTHADSTACPNPPDRSQGYVWGLYPYDIYTANADGQDLRLLAGAPGYDAEATISPDGKRIVFTSDRDGDLDLYAMDVDGSHLRRLTNYPGYDGGAFFSPDSSKIVFRGHHIADEKELRDYRDLLSRRLVRPTRMEIFLMNADGSNMTQVTNNGSANFCPFFHPDGKRIIFASNQNDPSGRNFDLFLIGVDGKNQEQITFDPTFDGFPMFSPDGKQLVFASNRQGSQPGETNIFIADWVEHPDHASVASASTLSLANESDLRSDISFLASDELKGRLTGSPEGRKAAEYVAAEFQKAGVLHPPGMKDYFQKFDFIAGVRLGARNSLSATFAGKQTTYQAEKDFIPTGFSSDATLLDVPAVFAGFGIRAPDLKQDDYAGLDVKDKVVIAYRFGPEGDDPKSEFSGYYPIRYKAMVAREQGAKALLVISQDPEDDELLVMRRDSTFGTSGIPVFSVKRSLVESWLEGSGKSLPDPANPHAEMSFDLKDVSISLNSDLIREKSEADNVLGWIPAAVPTEDTVVLGAHYDHLGLGIEGSLAEKSGEVHNGADDNASGVAGLLELARLYSKESNAPKRNLLFIAFGGEELGVLGSSYFVKHPIIRLKSILAMLNMDMIGRLRNDKLVVGGAGTSPVWKDILQKANGQGLSLSLNEDGYGPSDHAMFYSKEIPVLFFFTGSHPQYHRPEDDASTIEYEGLARVVNYVHAVTDRILNLPEHPDYVAVKSNNQEIAARGFRVYLGTIPDYTEEVKGVRLSGVRQGSPAEKAGLKAGDTIVEFAGKKIENIYDYTYALQGCKPDQTVIVVVLRGEASVTLQVTLEKRAAKE